MIDGNVAFGAGATILPHVRIGDGCVDAAGAVVTGDVPEDVIVAPVPARIVRRVDQSHAAGTRQEESRVIGPVPMMQVRRPSAEKVA